MSKKTERATEPLLVRPAGEKVITVIRTHKRLPPITLTFTLKAAGAMFADAHATRRGVVAADN